jgi:hypothetical protein
MSSQRVRTPWATRRPLGKATHYRSASKHRLVADEEAEALLLNQPQHKHRMQDEFVPNSITLNPSERPSVEDKQT